VIIQHLLPDAKSSLREILSGKTTLAVTEVQNNTSVMPNTIYVIPPNKNITLEGNTLKLLPRTHEGLNLPIDRFFTSLAAQKKHAAIGLVLSGTGRDGTAGARAIREAGGMTFAEDSTAEFSEMPESAIAAGVVDHILSPKEMAQKLVHIASGSSLHDFEEGRQNKDAKISEGEKEDLHTILMLLLGSSDVDFTYYKHGTIKRRIMRRMLLNNVKDLHEYADFLQKTPNELKLLYQDILIKVTDFFRDKEVFDFLKQKIFPAIFKDGPQSVRIWVPGCATGEEVYSLAITLTQYMDEHGKNVAVQIFGTDISEAALQTARQGHYGKRIEASVPREVLEKFFHPVGDGYTVTTDLRRMCVFARHNMVADVPFSKMDIVSCRNVLIYLDSMLQKKALPIFHYALNPKGFLILGTAETATSFQDLFTIFDEDKKIYAKKSTVSHIGLDFPRANPPTPARVQELPYPDKAPMSVEKEADSIVLSRHAPAGIIINDDLTIVQFRGDVSPYLKPVPGRATLDLIKMTHKTLLPKILEMLTNARKSGTTVKSTHASMGIAIEMIPLSDRPGLSSRGDSPSKDKHYLILFEESSPLEQKGEAGKKQSDKASGANMLELEEELTSTIDQLRALIETRDIANEALRSAHEEVLSANEELQSTNEELETTKEELQSTNEELITMNAELQDRNVDLKKIDGEHNKMVLQLQLRVDELSRKDEFISILGHELRNPLAPILYSLELIKLRDIQDPEVRRLLGGVERQAKLMDGIIQNLLDAARAIGGKIELERKPVDFDTLVRNAVQTTESFVKLGEHTLTFHPLDKPICLLLDPLRVEQIIVNLLHNAAKYTDSGGTITISAVRENAEIVLRVKDTGIGIAPDVMPHIFNLFFQANQSSPNVKGGLGVGLMLAKTLAELHGGSISVTSPGLGKGTECVVRLPIQEEIPETRGHDEEYTLNNMHLEKKCIFLVDDNVALADVFGMVLTMLDQDVTVFYDGASLLEAVRQRIPDVIFIDIAMPRMNGYELVSQLREMPGIENIGLIAVSGFGEEYRKKSEDAGFHHHLIKPVELKDVQRVLSEKYG
jgi:two-component system CheB/CheR fusion protein